MTARLELGPGDSPGFLLWRVTLDWQRQVVAALRPYQLTHVQFVLLASLRWLTAHDDQPPSQRQLAAHAGTDVMMTSTVLRALERRGLVIREPDGTDHRVRRLRLTAEGRRLATAATEIVEAADTRFFARAGSRVQALRLLQRLARPDDD